MSHDLHLSRGRVSTMPGSQHPIPDGTMCDDHPDRPAVTRIQGETDSMGCEYFCACQDCLDKFRSEKEALQGGSHLGPCSCGAQNVPLFARRDYDEGSAGPLYYKCRSCTDKWDVAVLKENEEYGVYDDFNYD
jgi:hypothetical protein